MPKAPPSPHRLRLTYLDGWRGISILMVMAGHFIPGMLSVASLGVELFFVLSGRLMADILFVERFPLGEFYKRRISRIYPGAVVFVLLTWIAMRGTDLSFKPAAVAAALTFTINYALVFTHGVPAIENLWSLCIEEHAYVMLGALALLLRRRGGSPVIPLLIAAGLSIADALISALVLHQDPRVVHWRTDAHVSSIFLASAIYLILRTRKVPAWVPVAAFAAAVAVSCGPDPLRYSLGTALFAVAVATLDHAPKPVLTGFSFAPLAQAGLWSYSVYLWQQPFYRLMLDATLAPWIAVLGAVAAGLVSFYFVEQPSRRWLNANWKLGRGKARAKAAPGAAPAPTPTP